MTKHDKDLPVQLQAIKLAGEHFRRKDAGDPFNEISRKLSDHTDTVLGRLKESELKTATLTDQVRQVEQYMARGFGGEPAAPKTWGELFTETKSAQLGELARVSKGSVELSVKGTVTSSPTSGGALGVPDRDAALNLLPRRRLTIRQLMDVRQMSSGTVEYVNQTTRPSAAAPVAEGALKAESDAAFSLVSVGAKTIAHWIKASRQILEDAPLLRDTIDQEMRYGLALAEENQILNGDGTGQNLNGLVANATAFSDPLALATPTLIDMIGSGILQSALAHFPATGVIVHPSDWQRMRLLKNAGGEYLLGDPQTAAEPRIFGLPVVATQAMSIDKFLVGDFVSAGTLFDRWEPRVEAAYSDDDFTRNLVTILAEERLAMAVKQPTALVYGDFGLVA